MEQAGADNFSASIVTPAPPIPRKKTLLFEDAYKSGRKMRMAQPSMVAVA